MQKFRWVLHLIGLLKRRHLHTSTHQNNRTQNYDTTMIVSARSLILLKRRLLTARPLSTAHDITGNLVRCSVRSAVEHFDDSVVDILSSNNDARPKLNQTISIDSQLHLAHILKSFEVMRYDAHYATNAQLTGALQAFEQLQVEGTSNYSVRLYPY
jgi:hypothetical protein